MIIQQLFNGVVQGSYYILVAIGLSIIYGILGISHFAHGSVTMLGGYICYLIVTNMGIGLIPAMLISMVMIAILGMVIERVGYRPLENAPPINAFIIALGIGMLIENVVQFLFGPDQVIIPNNIQGAVSIGGLLMVKLRLYLILTAIALVAALALYMKYTKLGKAIRATAQNREASILVGINTNIVKSIVFAIGSLLGGVAGSFIGTLYAVYPSMGNATVMKGFAVLILGGLGSIPGAVVGGLIIGITESLGSMFISSEFKDIFAFIIMIIVLMVRPQGLFGTKER
ncbi:MAG: branched-chain amino acid ABC transporter permease [Lachnospiraceae bacterium]